MLVNNVRGDRFAAAIVRDSEFYIEVAKFVQAYNTIIKNPNEFLTEVGESTIDENTQRLSWAQFVKIVEHCDLGFNGKVNSTDLLVYYNYALQIGSIDGEMRLASVSDIANAQKHYYNFIDEATERAHKEYEKQHQISVLREKEAGRVDTKLGYFKSGVIVSAIIALVGVLLFVVGFVGFFIDNAFVRAFGNIIPVWNRQYMGAIVLIVWGLLIFAIFDYLCLNLRVRHFKLKKANDYLFERADESFDIEDELKTKFDNFKKNLSVVQAELADPNKKFDVTHNIEELKAHNKYYQRFAEKTEENEYSSSENANENQLAGNDEAEFAPVRLTKEQQENLHQVSKEAITLEGVLDEEAYNEKFEKTDKEFDVKEQASEAEQQEQEESQEQENSIDLNDENILASLDLMSEIMGVNIIEKDERQNS